MKKVTDYVEVGELCDAPDGSVLKCIEDKDALSCTRCDMFGNTICCKIKCSRFERLDRKEIVFKNTNP